MKTILLQLDTDPQPSVFDAVVAVDSGVDQLFRHGGATPENIRELVHGCLFTRGLSDLKHTAVFIGGSNVQQAEAVMEAVRSSFFGPFSVSVLLDPNGANTTAAAAVLKATEGMGGSMQGTVVAVLGGTGPVGNRVARLLAREGARVKLGSRKLDRAEAAAKKIQSATGALIQPFATESEDALRTGLNGVPVIVAAGAGGAVLLPKSARETLEGIKVLIDLNAIPPLGIEGVDATDKAKDRDGALAWGALGVGGTKMKIHKRAVAALFETNTHIFDAESILDLGKSLG
jgi:hypothetical protein